MKPAAHQYEDKLLELAYGELPATEASAVESHVRGCARCSEALGEIRAVRSTMGQLPMVPAPEAGLESLFAYADQAARRNAAGPAPADTWWRRMMRPLAAVSALVVLGVVGLYVVKSPEGGTLKGRQEMALESAKSRAPAADAPVAAAAPVQAPAPIVAATPPPAELKEEQVRNLYGAPADSLAEKKEEAKPTRMMPKPMPAPKAAKVVDSRNGELGGLLDDAKAVSNKKQKEAARDDYDAPQGNYQRSTGSSRALSKDSSAFAKNDVAASDKSGADPQAFGLNAGPTGHAASTPVATPKTEVAEREALAPAKPAAQVATVQPGGGGTRGAAAPEPTQAAPMAPPPPPMNMPSQQQSAQRTSLSIGGRGDGNADRKRNESGYVAANQVANDMDESNRRVVYEFEAQLKRARQAEQQNDMQTEASIALEVLRHEPTGAQRMQALQYACRALQDLNEADVATKYCAALANEFPGNAVGQQFVRNQQRPAPARAKKNAYQPDEEKALQQNSEPATLSR